MALPDSGAVYCAAAMATEELQVLRRLANEAPSRSPGWRISNNASLGALLVEGGTIDSLAQRYLGETARAVRAVLFNKTEETNWGVSWHQDRTIAVQEKHQLSGFDVWSRKAGLLHVEPPFEIISQMITLRIHLDSCDEENSPLMYVPGSHALGRVPENTIDQIANELGNETCLADAGDVWLYATGIIHASDPALKPRARRVLQLDFAAAELPKPLEWLGV